MESLLLGMQIICEQAVEKLGKALWPTTILCTRHTQKTEAYLRATYLCTKSRTGFAQFFRPFTQAKNSTFNLFYYFLYPVSTAPINNTNLIKE